MQERIPDLIRPGTPFVSFEFFPPRDEEARQRMLRVGEELKVLHPLFVSVTCGAGGGGGRGTLQAANMLHTALGYRVMPHLTCCGLEPKGVDDALAQFQANGINNVLALRGDGTDGNGPDGDAPLQHASDLVEHIRKSYPDIALGVAAYPEPHPQSPSVQADIDMLRFKLDAGSDFGVTQLFFDNRRYFDMVERLADQGCHKPVIPGIMPLRTMASARRILSLCGAAIPGNLYAALEKAHAQGGDDAVREVGTAHAVQQVQGLLNGGAPGIHLYPLNQSSQCLDVAQQAGLLG
ncbi:5,10-methylenetetrahydrofolate reductase (NAD(P)) [Paucidesulfovibrio gracilis DSM 16080]|uniref:Methylenetetrahydrofolate reductase n=1 Tax=Paucidesulfovibrio gracilis DSM 16080 TaxID=1121449 RepID=A0A1T4XPK3_9BACT|nr:methylenetetrahydrofolate reductase [Paucidesulfovibrio gracilis]SKA91462.1 5,10-methylenetetrahydrofolate reductase (NAD(P)) [Paucidesulfovibrio gracilis DSM 16080]